MYPPQTGNGAVIAPAAPPATPYVTPAHIVAPQQPAVPAQPPVQPQAQPAAPAAPPAGALAPNVGEFIQQNAAANTAERNRAEAEQQELLRYKGAMMQMLQTPGYAQTVLDFMDGKPAPGGLAHQPLAPASEAADIDPDVQQYVNQAVGTATQQIVGQIAQAFAPYQKTIETLRVDGSLNALLSDHQDARAFAPDIATAMKTHPTLSPEQAYRMVAFDKATESAATNAREEGMRIGSLRGFGNELGSASHPNPAGLSDDARKAIASDMNKGNTAGAVAAGLEAAFRQHGLLGSQ